LRFYRIDDASLIADNTALIFIIIHQGLLIEFYTISNAALIANDTAFIPIIVDLI